MAMQIPPVFPPVFDWNFDEVPEGELIAGCYWEYARESFFIRETLRKYHDWIRRGGLMSDGGGEICRELEQIRGIGYVADVFVRGCTLEPRGATGAADHEGANSRHPEAPMITGSFPGPWRALAPEERRERAEIRNARTEIPLVPFKRGSRQDAKEIARWSEDRFLEREQAREQVLRENPGVSREELFQQGKMREQAEIQPSLWSGGGELTMVQIQWGDFTNEELIQYFRRWVKVNRPKHLPGPDLRGEKPKDWRARLTRLAALRLLGRFSAMDLVSRDRLPEIWKTKQFSGRQWSDVTKWHDARREARQLLGQMFPFLPKDELPLSWHRPPPGK